MTVWFCSIILSVHYLWRHIKISSKINATSLLFPFAFDLFNSDRLSKINKLYIVNWLANEKVFKFNISMNNVFYMQMMNRQKHFTEYFLGIFLLKRWIALNDKLSKICNIQFTDKNTHKFIFHIIYALLYIGMIDLRHYMFIHSDSNLIFGSFIVYFHCIFFACLYVNY